MSDGGGAPRARRPLWLCALALLAGSLAGAQAPQLVACYGLGAAAAVGFLAGNRSSMGRGTRIGAGLLVLGCLQALRASEAADDLAPRGGSACVFEGRWSVLLESPDASRGRLLGAGNGAKVFQLPSAAAREGERLRLRPAAAARDHARGPVERQRQSAVIVRADEIERLAPAEGTLQALRSRLRARCDRFDNERTAALARALLLGDRTRLDAGLADVFTRTGLRHLLAVSGLHVGLFGALLALPAAWVLARAMRTTATMRQDCVRVLSAAAVVVYAPLAGGAPPVRRAAMACALAFLAPLVPSSRRRRLGRATDGLSTWSGALVLELCAEPLAHRAVGVQLSYTATLGLLLGARVLAQATSRGASPATPCMQPSWMRRWSGALARRLGRIARQALVASGIASLATLPLTWLHFGEWSPLGALATPLALLLLAWILLGGWLALLDPARLGAWLVDQPITALCALASTVDGLPGTPVALPERPTWALLAAGALGLAALASAAGPRRDGQLARCAALAWSLLLVPWSPEPRELELVALDVGHGTAIALRGPGIGAWVFDAGSRDRPGVGRSALGPLLARWDPGRVAVVLSHDQQDHSSGLGWLTERRPPWLWAGALPALLDERLPHSALRLDLGGGRLALTAPGSREGPRLTLLRGLEAPGNEGSRSLLVSWQGRSALLSGDAEQDGLRALLAEGVAAGRLEILLLPHHGSHTPLLGPLLDATRPREVWVSSGEPPATSRELTRRGQPWRCTATEGPLLARWGPLGSEERRHGNR